ncbi:DnaJ domain [Pseudocohnilembus persalinus]|uniref:DnaJ domain n=1 Tax=Pseudocohnilembus persalinus TaxID=266149 RepID=A0A0V0QLG9_PSEPJ|nr:DnaJ domain [Pseudocohnilembus persalinus]|eukprot:KRX02972.1 DnaJ domain [Pseudocohnilembus persalinus]
MIRQNCQQFPKIFVKFINKNAFNYNTGSLSIDQCFSVLTLKQNKITSFLQVKEKYYQLSKLYHPDINQNKEQKIKNTEQFQKLNEAFNILKEDYQKNPDKYDKFGPISPDQDPYQYYKKITQQELYYKHFKKTFEEDPWAQYNTQNQEAKQKYDRELNLMKRYQEMENNQQKQETFKNYSDFQGFQQDLNSQNHQNANFYTSNYSYQNNQQKVDQQQENSTQKSEIQYILGLLAMGIVIENKQKKKHSQFVNKNRTELEKIAKIAEDSQNFDLTNLKGQKAFLATKDYEDLPKIFLDALPKKDSYEYNYYCSQPIYRQKQAAMIMYYLQLPEIPYSRDLVRQRFHICPGFG